MWVGCRSQANGKETRVAEMSVPAGWGGIPTGKLEGKVVSRSARRERVGWWRGDDRPYEAPGRACEGQGEVVFRSSFVLVYGHADRDGETGQ